MKKSLAQAAAILGIVFGALEIILGGIFFIAAFSDFFEIFIIFTAVFVGFGTAQVVCGSAIQNKIRNNQDARGNVVALTIISFFGGSWITFILGLVALGSQEDININQNQNANNYNNNYGNNYNAGYGTAPNASAGYYQFKKSVNDFEQAVLRIKQYRRDGVMSYEAARVSIEEAAKKCADEINLL